MKIDHDAWVVLADGRKALFTQNVGTLFGPKLEVRRVLEAEPNPPTRAQGTDRPGRSFDSGSGRPSAVEQTDWHAQAEANFAKKVAQAIETLLDAESSARIVLVAAPKTLAELRTSLPPAVRERTTGEVDKDLTKHPIEEVEKILAGL